MTAAVRVAQARLLVRPLWRTRAWSLVPLSAAAVVAITVVVRLAGRVVDPVAPVTAAAFLMAGAAGFALDDAAAVVVASSPSPPAFRAGFRVFGVVVAVACCWFAVLAYAASFAPSVPLARPTLLLAVLVSVGLLAASLWGGVAAPPALVTFLVVSVQLPDRWAVVEDRPGSASRLIAILVAAATALALRCRRDPVGHGLA